jgi:hypothetical protein
MNTPNAKAIEWSLPPGCLRNSVDTQFRTFFHFRTFRKRNGISENAVEVYGIFCRGIRYTSEEFCGSPQNFVTVTLNFPKKTCENFRFLI